MTSSTAAWAQQSTSTAGATTAIKAPSPFSISAAISKSMSLYDFQDGERQESNDFELIPAYTWSGGRSLAVFAFSDDLRDPGQSDIGDIALVNILKGWSLPRIKLTPSFTVIAPQSKDSRLNKNLETAVSAKLSASIQEKLLLPGFSFSGGLSVGRSFHRYETAVDGSVLNQYSFKQNINAGYSIGIFSFDLEFYHNNAWSYRGTLKESFEHSEEASIAMGDHFGFTLGHTNSGSVFKEDGYSSNYKLINEKTSLVYAKVSMQY